jgi:hypothetical protein
VERPFPARIKLSSVGDREEGAMLLRHRLAGTARAPTHVSQRSPCLTAIRAAPRTRVAKPGLSATSESKSEQTVTVKAPQAPKTGDFIAGPYGLGRVSLDAAGECSCGCQALLAGILLHVAHSALYVHTENNEDVLEIPTLRHMLEPR